jgi:hypothetical protein
MKGRGCGNEVLYQHLPGGTEEKHEEPPFGQLMLWLRFKPCNSQTQAILPLSCDRNRICYRCKTPKQYRLRHWREGSEKQDGIFPQTVCLPTSQSSGNTDTISSPEEGYARQNFLHRCSTRFSYRSRRK